MKIISILVILSVIAYPCFCMPVPSQPAKEDPVTVQAGGALNDVSASILAIFIGFPLVGIILLFDGDEDNDSEGYAFLISGFIISMI